MHGGFLSNPRSCRERWSCKLKFFLLIRIEWNSSVKWVLNVVFGVTPNSPKHGEFEHLNIWLCKEFAIFYFLREFSKKFWEYPQRKFRRNSRRKFPGLIWKNTWWTWCVFFFERILWEISKSFPGGLSGVICGRFCKKNESISEGISVENSEK